MYTIYRTAMFDKEFDKILSHEDQKHVQNFEKKQLTQNPLLGKPLGVSFLREKKVEHKRVYYLIYDDLKAVLMVGISDKKAQEHMIQDIKEHLKLYHEDAKAALMQHDEFFPASHV